MASTMIPRQAPAMPQTYGNGLNGMPGMNPQQPASWGFGPRAPNRGPAPPPPPQQKPGENETEFEEDEDATDSDDASTGSEEDGETESEDETTDHNRLSPMSGQHPGFPFTQQPLGITRLQQPHAPPMASSPSAGLTPEVLAGIRELVQREIVPSVVEKLQRSPSDCGTEPREIPTGLSPNRDAPSIASSAQTEPPAGAHSRPPTFARGLTEPKMPSTHASHAPPLGIPVGGNPVNFPGAVPDPAGPNRPIYRSNSSVAVQPPNSSLRNGQQSPTSLKHSVRFTDRGPPVNGATPGKAGEDLMKPYPPLQAEYSSPVDSKWGMLFDKSGTPTPRLESVFRGLAKFLIDEIEPKGSLVVTPQKMGMLYQVSLNGNDPIGYFGIFKGNSQASHSALSELYLAIGAEYHLVPAVAREAPTVPGLTPTGFATWCKTNVLAYPEEEAMRLNRVFETWPVNADGPLESGRAERLPKMLSRHLLPKEPTIAQRGMFENGIQKFKDVLRQASKCERVTGAVLTAEKRNSSHGALYLNGAGARAGRLSDDEQGRRRSTPAFSEVDYHTGSRRDGERKHSSSSSNGETRHEPRRASSTVSSRPPVSGNRGHHSLERVPSTGRRSPPRRHSHRASEADITYGTSPTYDSFPRSKSVAFAASGGHGVERKYHGRSRDERDREHERDREYAKSHERYRESRGEYGRDRSRNRDWEITRDRERDRPRDRDRERERDRDRDPRDSDKEADYRLSSSGRKRNSTDVVPRSEVSSRRRSDIFSGSDRTNDSNGPTWNEIGSLASRLIRAATFDSSSSSRREKRRGSG